MSTFELSNTSKSALVSTSEFAKIIGRESQTIRIWLCKDRLPEGLPRPKKINNRHYWLRKDIEDYILSFSTT